MYTEFKAAVPIRIGLEGAPASSNEVHRVWVRKNVKSEVGRRTKKSTLRNTLKNASSKHLPVTNVTSSVPATKKSVDHQSMSTSQRPCARHPMESAGGDEIDLPEKVSMRTGIVSFLKWKPGRIFVNGLTRGI